MTALMECERLVHHFGDHAIALHSLRIGDVFWQRRAQSWTVQTTREGVDRWCRPCVPHTVNRISELSSQGGEITFSIERFDEGPFTQSLVTCDVTTLIEFTELS